MKRYLMLILILACSCERDVKFQYEEIRSRSAILIKNFRPTSREEFNKFLFSIKDSLKMDSINVFLLGEDVNKINPQFKENYYRGELGRMDLASFNNDTIRAMHNLQLWMGSFKGTTFTKNDVWDDKLLGNRFFTESDR